MTALSVPILRSLTAGEILDTSFQLYRRCLGAIFLASIVSSAPAGAVDIYIGTLTLGVEHEALDMFSNLLGVFGLVAGWGATTWIVSETYLHRTGSVDDAFRHVGSRFGGLLAVDFLSGLAIMVGLVALIIPGIILWGGFMLAPQVLLIESSVGASRALDRSWKLSAGLRAKLIGCAVMGYGGCALVTTIAILAGILGTELMGFDSETVFDGGALGGLVAIVGFALLQATLPFIPTVKTVVYYDARIRKEGLDLEVLTEGLA